jgi:hypothetical protein
LTGIHNDSIPCEATFSNFHSRIGEALYKHIFHALISIVEEIGLVSFNILAADGTLFPPPLLAIMAIIAFRIPVPPSLSTTSRKRFVTECSIALKTLPASFPESSFSPKIKGNS